MILNSLKWNINSKYTAITATSWTCGGFLPDIYIYKSAVITSFDVLKDSDLDNHYQTTLLEWIHTFHTYQSATYSIFIEFHGWDLLITDKYK